MVEEDFEGTLVLERLAEVGQVEAFLDAIDSDDLDRVRGLMRRAGIDDETIRFVMSKIAEESN